MKLSEHSKALLVQGFKEWAVPSDYADPIFNYLVSGFHPGSFFAAVLANDFSGAIMHSHTANNIKSLKDLVGWMGNYLPPQAWGSYETVKEWLTMDEQARRNVLVSRQLIYDEQTEIMLILQG